MKKDKKTYQVIVTQEFGNEVSISRYAVGSIFLSGKTRLKPYPDNKCVETVTNPKYERNYQVGKLEKRSGYIGTSCYVIGVKD